MAGPDEETYGSPTYDLTEAGNKESEAEPRNPDPNFNPEVNEDDVAGNDASETVGVKPDSQQFIIEGRPVIPVPDVKPPETEDVDTDFYVAQKLDERRLVKGTNPYLDDVERERAEIQRAKIEDREPDLENPPAVQGTPLYTEAVARQSGLRTDHIEPDSVLPVKTIVG